ncbi:SRPBCC family protein [Humisphaera borealis]|uniref:SRPBCC domain-containing protein n=1 Tax=Humisphaera borealis TaxID=2807512 RepID=A0A7M2WTN4_9BACT|nr:SRPBCC family protein [Humisphaera borealis]QOV88181.1 SRPBCC domain-containing protein [Humisphaera borealis]
MPANPPKRPADRPDELYITRVYDAPVSAVWDAWTDTEQVAKWWGPRGFTLTTHSKDLRVGGHWTYIMHGPDGTDYPNKTTYYEVEPGRKLVYDHGASDDRPPLFRVTVFFTEEDGKTRMDMTMSLATPEAATEIKKFIKKAGGEATWDRLAEYLGKERAGKELFVINRTFSAPIETMFEVWTNPDHFSQWIPPTGFTMKFIRADIRPGGSTFYVMTGGNNLTMYGRAHYIEIARPHRLVYTQEFVDEQENISRHPLAPTWPPAMLTIVTFTEEGPDKTRVTVEWQPHGNSTAEEIATFVQSRAGMTMGWTGSFDKLEAKLAAR